MFHKNAFTLIISQKPEKQVEWEQLPLLGRGGAGAVRGLYRELVIAITKLWSLSLKLRQAPTFPSAISISTENVAFDRGRK